MKRKLIWLVLGIAFALRAVAVTGYPAGFNADEASFGYDAYSILRTGHDQWGQLLPLTLKSFGDFKSPLYSYIDIPFVKILGLNVFSVRLPNAIVGTLAVFMVYLVTKEVFKNQLSKNKKADSLALGLVSAFLLAINPWSVMISRGGFEFNLVTLFIPVAVYFFLKEKYILSVAVFGLSMFTYHSAKVITPLLLVTLIIFYWKKIILINKRTLFTSFFILLIFTIGILYTFKIGGGSRISERSITQGSLEQGFQDRVTAELNGQNPTLAKAFHNKYQVIVSRFINNYFEYFTPRFLFVSGSVEAYYGMIPGIGALYWIDAVFFIGLIPFLAITRPLPKIFIFILFWLLISVLPAALSTGTGYSGNRASGMIPAIQIVEAFGLYGWYRLFNKTNIKILGFASAVLIIISFVELGIFIRSYFITPAKYVLGQMLYGNLDAVNWLNKNAVGRKVLISRSISEPQIFLAFNYKWDPGDYQRYSGNWDIGTSVWLDQTPSYSLGNFTVKSIDWKNDWVQSQIIVIRANENTAGFVPVKIFNFPDGSPNIYIMDTSQKIYAKNI